MVCQVCNSNQSITQQGIAYCQDCKYPIGTDKKSDVSPEKYWEEVYTWIRDLWWDLDKTKKQLELFQKLTQTIDITAQNYNANPDSLKEFAVTTVSLTEETLAPVKIAQSKEITFHEDSKGIFWVIKINERYYLLPKADLKLNARIYDWLKLCYDCLGEEEYYLPIQLVKAASVRLAGNNLWLLIQRGVLTFESADSSCFVKNEVPPTVLENPLKQKEQFQSLVVQLSQQVEIAIATQLKPLTQQISELNQNLLQLQNQSEELGSKISLEKSSNAAPILSWLELYNNRSDYITTFAIPVKETDTSFHERMSKQRKAPILERSFGGNYWIFQDQKNERFYLLPKRNLKLNKHSLDELQTFFQVETDQWNVGSTFWVINPAIVTLLAVGEQWELKERGQMEFKSE